MRYLMWVTSGEATTARGVAFNIRDPLGLAYSPDGNCIAVGGQIGSDVGTFIVRISDGNVQRVTDLAMSPDWSPDGAFLGGVDSAVAGHESLVVIPAKC